MQTKPAHHAATPVWPPALESYDYLSSLVARDWAWEGLRRNQSYQAEARAHTATATITDHLEGRVLVTRMQEASPPAHAWALCTFRRSVPHGSAGPSRLAARRRCVDTHWRDRAGLRVTDRE
jgi:hypothetical protein